MMLYPLTFQPIFKERVWGGRKMEELFHKSLPPHSAIGESWEISDRPGDESLIANGPLAGKTLHWLLDHHSSELLGRAKAQNGRFPLLLKILDAREMLSLQVHPPTEMALKLGGEPKTELWYIMDAAPGAELYAGLKKGVTRDKFERSIETGAVADCIYRQRVEADDAMFLPSGRVHAVGAGLVIFEIQQNSDTTYRAFDWNRVDMDGKPRSLHLAESLASIDFNDFEPALVSNRYENIGQLKSRHLANDKLFSAQLLHCDTNQSVVLPKGRLNIFGVTKGRLTIMSETLSMQLERGGFALIPSAISVEVRIEAGASFVMVQPGE